MEAATKKIIFFIETIVLIFDFFCYIKTHKTFLISLFLAIIFILFYGIKNYITRIKNDLNIPENIKFIIEFIDDIGYSNKRKIAKMKDNKHEIISINKIYVINGINCNTNKIYKGIVTDKLSDGLKIMTCGGSSTSIKDMKILTYAQKKNNFKKTNYVLLKENERVKIIKLPFEDNISSGHQFKVKYVEKNWSGSMRNDYDGIIVAEHLLFKKVRKQEVTIVFEQGQISKIDVYSYNIKNHELIKLDNIIHKEDDKTYSWVHTTVKSDENIVYFISYTYKTPLNLN